MHSLAPGTQARLRYLLAPLTGARGQWFSEKQDSYFSLSGGRALSSSSPFTGSGTSMEYRASDICKIKTHCTQQPSLAAKFASRSV